MNQALRKKLGVIEIKREAELKEKERVEKNETKEKTKIDPSPKQRRRRATIANIGTEMEPRKNYSGRNSLIDQERRLHEAYQLILGEHHKRLNQRHGSVVQFEMEASIKSLPPISLSHQPCPCLQILRPTDEGKSKQIYISHLYFNKKIALILVTLSNSITPSFI